MCTGEYIFYDIPRMYNSEKWVDYRYVQEGRLGLLL